LACQRALRLLVTPTTGLAGAAAWLCLQAWLCKPWLRVPAVLQYDLLICSDCMSRMSKTGPSVM